LPGIFNRLYRANGGYGGYGDKIVNIQNFDKGGFRPYASLNMGPLHSLTKYG
jgi:hypothetical protein